MLNKIGKIRRLEELLYNELSSKKNLDNEEANLVVALTCDLNKYKKKYKTKNSISRKQFFKV